MRIPGLVLALVAVPPLFAQSPAPAAPGVAAGPAAAKRPTVAVMDFDYGTVNNWWGQYDIGHGIATQLVYALVEEGGLRIIERSQLAAVLGEQDFATTDRASPEASKLAKVGHVLGVRYIIAGSVTNSRRATASSAAASPGPSPPGCSGRSAGSRSERRSRRSRSPPA